MTATSMAPYLDFFGTIVVAELWLTVDGACVVVLAAEPVVEVEAVDLVPDPDPDADPEPVAVVRVVAAVEFPLVVAVADEVTLELRVDDPAEVWAKTAPDEDEDEDELVLEETEDAAPEPEEETDWPLQEPEILMLW